MKEPDIRPGYIDSGSEFWSISLSAAVGFFKADVLAEWLQLGFAALNDRVFFRRMSTDKAISITVGIPFKHVDTALVESAASIVKRYIAQADRESGRGVSPNLQVYMSQIPIDILRTLLIDAEDFERVQGQSFVRALRLLACDVPDCRARGALKLTPNHTTEATHFASHAYFVNVCCPSLINETHLQVSSPHAAVSLEHIEQIFKGLNVDIIYKRLTYIEVSKVKLIAAHVVIPKGQENVMWEAYGSQVPEVTIEYLTSEASMKIPTHAQRAQLESPLQHWQNYSNVHEVPASRLSFFRPADEHDTIAFERYAFSARSLTLGCDTIVTQEAIPIIHIHHDKHKEIPVRDLLLQALKNYPKKSIAGLDEIACELFADERKLVLLETPPPGQHNCSAYAIYQVTGRDTIRLPQFNTNKGIVHAAYSGTLALSNFDNAILVAPFRPDARHVYGASGSVSIDLIYFVQRLGQPEPRDIISIEYSSRTC